MLNKSLASTFGAMIACLCVAVVFAPTYAQDQLDPAADRIVDELEGQPDPNSQRALSESAASYAKDYGVTIEEATRRLRLQRELENALAEVEKVLGNRFAGAWIEHEPRYRGVVRLKGDVDKEATVAAQSIVKQTDPPIEFVGGAEASMKLLTEQLESALPTLQSRSKNIVGAEVDVRTGEIVIFVGEDAVVEKVQQMQEAIQQDARELLKSPVRVESVDAPVGDGHTRGGAHLSNCTSGFVVRHPSTGTRG